MTLVVFIGRMLTVPLRILRHDEFWFVMMVVSIIGLMVFTCPESGRGAWHPFLGWKPVIGSAVSLAISILGIQRDSLASFILHEWHEAKMTARAFEKTEPSDEHLLRPM